MTEAQRAAIEAAQKRIRQRAAVESAIARMAEKQAPKGPGFDTPVQVTSGINEGLAGLAGAPVDMMSGAINAGVSGVNALAGTEYQGIEKPFLGSEHIRGLLAPVISEQQPQGAVQRYGRRIGRELGAMAIPGLAMAGKAQKPMALAGGMLGEAIGAGTAGQVTEDMGAPAAVQMAAELAGGLAAPAAAFRARDVARAPSLGTLQQRADAGYQTVRESGARLTPDARDHLVDAIRDKLRESRMHPRVHPKASAQMDATDEIMGRNPDLYSVEQERQLWGDVAGSVEPGERRLGKIAKEEIDNYLSQVSPGMVTGTNNVGAVVDALRDARANQNKVYKSRLLEGEDVGLLDRARRRAARSGTGGNEINAIRQNVSKILENPKLRRGYNEQELSLMREIADGTSTDNALRSVGRSLSPTTGALQGLANMAMTGQGIMTGNPAWLIPGAAGYAATGLGQSRINKKVDQLAEMIRRGGPAPQKTMSDTERRLIAALLASQTPDAASPLQ